jgi:hypothetical protein
LYAIRINVIDLAGIRGDGKLRKEVANWSLEVEGSGTNTEQGRNMLETLP